MAKLSAGLLLYRIRTAAAGPGPAEVEVAVETDVEVLIVHPGGPLWARKDAGAWSIPKGEYDPGADPWAAARREFAEEVGTAVPAGARFDLGDARQRSGKIITVFAVAGDLDVTGLHSNEFRMQWPPGSGRMQSFPEVDRAGWFPISSARTRLNPGQVPFLDRLRDRLAPGPEPVTAGSDSPKVAADTRPAGGG